MILVWFYGVRCAINTYLDIEQIRDIEQTECGYVYDWHWCKMVQRSVKVMDAMFLCNVWRSRFIDLPTTCQRPIQCISMKEGALNKQRGGEATRRSWSWRYWHLPRFSPHLLACHCANSFPLQFTMQNQLAVHPMHPDWQAKGVQSQHFHTNSLCSDRRQLDLRL